MIRQGIFTALLGLFALATSGQGQTAYPEHVPAIGTTPVPTTGPTYEKGFPNPISDCQRCADTRDMNNTACQTAFKGAPGKFCHVYVVNGSADACCCPSSTQCPMPSIWPTVCICNQYTSGNYYPSYTPSYSNYSYSYYPHYWLSPLEWVIVIASSLVFIGLIVGFCWRRHRTLRQRENAEAIYVENSSNSPSHQRTGGLFSNFFSGTKPKTDDLGKPTTRENNSSTATTIA